MKKSILFHGYNHLTPAKPSRITETVYIFPIDEIAFAGLFRHGWFNPPVETQDFASLHDAPASRKPFTYFRLMKLRLLVYSDMVGLTHRRDARFCVST